MEVIKSKEKWEGTDGHASTIMTKLKSSVQSVNRAIKDNLKQGSELQLMAYQMALDCQTFHNHVISHISSEFINLIEQMKLPEDAAKKVLSAQLRIVFSHLFNVRKDVYPYTKSRDGTQYCTRVIWCSLKAHMLCKKMLENDLSGYPPISTAFIRFLTEQQGANSAAGLENKMNTMESKLTGLINGAKKKADEGVRLGTSALDHSRKLMKKNELKNPDTK